MAVTGMTGGAQRAAWMMAIAAGLLSGCGESEKKSGKSDTSDEAGDVDSVTWHLDVAPIVVEKCSGCHREGGVAPFSMESYESAKPFAKQIAEAAEEGRMPPFLAQDTKDCTPRLPWLNDIRLSDAEKKTLRAWADAEAPEGDADEAAELIQPAKAVLEREDAILTIPEEVTVSGNKDLHRCVIIDPKIEEDSYVIGRLITAGNPAVLHHVVSYVILPGTNEDTTPRTKAQLEEAVKAQKGVGIGGSFDCFSGPAFDGTVVRTEMLDAWAPGGIPNLAPEDSGQPLDKDALVVLDMHYHPVGEAQKDSTTKLSLMLSKDVPSRIARTILIGNFEGVRDTMYGVGELLMQKGESKPEFLIPADAKDHVEEMTWTWKAVQGEGLRVMGMGTHMHYVGRNMRVTLEHKSKGTGDDSECLIETPAWDFNWQRGYGYDAKFEDLPLMAAGDVLRMRCVFDNTMDNPFVVEALDDQGKDAPVDVPLGEDTLNEMCLAAIGITYANPSAAQ
jgi:hypothetical protein